VSPRATILAAHTDLTGVLPLQYEDAIDRCNRARGGAAGGQLWPLPARRDRDAFETRAGFWVRDCGQGSTWFTADRAVREPWGVCYLDTARLIGQLIGPLV
jgi:hypothetical protein